MCPVDVNACLVEVECRQQPAKQLNSAGPAIHRGLAHLLAQDEMQDQLSACCASDDTVNVRTEFEERQMKALMEALSTSSIQQDQEVLCPEVRKIVVWFMAHVVESMNLPEKTWFDMVTLLDLYCLRSSKPIEVGDIPSLCGALVRLLKKFDTVIPSSDDDLMVYIMHLAQYLRNAGHTVPHPAVSLQSLETHEKVVLEALDWKINLSSVDTWMSTFYARMNSLTGQALLPTLRLTWNHSLGLARTMLMQKGSSLSLSRRHAARGLLGIGFVAARLLAPEVLGLDSLDDLEEPFNQLLAMNDTNKDSTVAGGPPGQLNPSAQVMPAGCHEFFLELLQVTTCSSLAALQEDCRLVQHEMKNGPRTPKQVHYESI